MNVMPVVAFIFGLLAVILYYSGLPEASLVPMALGVLFGVTALLFGSKEEPTVTRATGAIAAVFALMPVAIPFVQQLRIDQLASERARETRPLYERFEERVEEAGPLIDRYFDRHGFYPDLRGGEYLPHIGGDGRPRTPPSLEGLASPRDPFSPTNASFRWAAVRDRGVLLVSVGQSGVAEFPVPPLLMDPPPASAHAGFALTGADPRHHTYDPTNGALGLGDLVAFRGRVSYEEAMEPVFSAWDTVHRRTTWIPPAQRPTPRGAQTTADPDSQSSRDAREAARLLDENNHLAALALASRAHQERPRHEAQWSDDERRIPYIRAVALYHLGAFRESADIMMEYLDLEPNDAAGHFHLGAALHQGGRESDALTHLAAAAQIDPNHRITPLATQCYEAALARRAPPFPPPRGLER